MNLHTRQITHAWVTAARHTRSSIIRRLCLGRALRRCTCPHHAERIRAAIAAQGNEVRFRTAADIALSWLVVELKVSSLDFGPGQGIGFEHMMRG